MKKSLKKCGKEKKVKNEREVLFLKRGTKLGGTGQRDGGGGLAPVGVRMSNSLQKLDNTFPLKLENVRAPA